jgi:hypothetical protein
MLADEIGMFVQGIRFVIDLSVRGVESSPWGLVDEIVPVSIEAGHGTMVDSHKERLQRWLSEDRMHEAKGGQHDKNMNGDPWIIFPPKERDHGDCHPPASSLQGVTAERRVSDPTLLFSAKFFVGRST